jgi:hypothetical protein
VLRAFGRRALDTILKKSFIATLLFVAACTDPAPRPSSQPTAGAQPQDSKAKCEQFAREGLKLKARNRAGLDAEAGRPDKTTVQVVPNRHNPNQQDSIIRLEYDGMIVQLRKPGPGGEMFEYVSVDKRKWLNFPFFKPGVPAENVIAAIGEPQQRDANHLVYNCGGREVDNPVVFELKGGDVERIVFNYYVD